MNKEKNFISAVIYVHNAEERIGEFLSTMVNVLEENFEHSEIICVNDRSNDNSAEIIRKTSATAKNTSISLLNMSYYHGIEAAMNAGVELSIGDFVFEFDSTFMDYDESEIMNVYRHSLKGYDIVSASSDKKQRASSSFFYWLYNKSTTLKQDISTNSFRILSRRALNRISNINKSTPYRKAVYSTCGLKTDNLVYKRISEKKSSIEKQEKKYRSRLAMDALILFTDFGYKISFSLTVLMMIIAVIMGVYSIGTFIFGNPIEGWTTTVLFMSFAFFGLFAILTFIVKYLQIIVNLIFKRKSYSFEGLEKLTK